uniref:YadA-like family protein n=1 Tax=Enterobacter hormaechei TaxID=158836 RepID=UPI0034CD6BF6
ADYNNNHKEEGTAENINNLSSPLSNNKDIERTMGNFKSYTNNRFNQVENEIENNKRAIKRLGAASEATANLHFNANHSGYAIAAGEYDGETALAAGVQFRTSKTTAISLQASYDAESTGGSIGLHGDF